MERLELGSFGAGALILIGVNDAVASRGWQGGGKCAIPKSDKQRIDPSTRGVLLGHRGVDGIGPARAAAGRIGTRVEDRRWVVLGQTVKSMPPEPLSAFWFIHSSPSRISSWLLDLSLG